MSENNWAALMLKLPLTTDTDLTSVVDAGLYPVPAGNATAPQNTDGTGLSGTMIVRYNATVDNICVTFFPDITPAIFTLIGGIGGTWATAGYAETGAAPATRKVNGHPLTTDVNVTSSDIFSGQTVEIAASVNLNTITTPGLYTQGASAEATTALNYPEAIAGTLTVYKSAGIIQVYRTYSNPATYVRSFYSGTWSAWSKNYDSAHKPTYADVGALAAGGTAVAATKLATARTINGVSFNGTANITIPVGVTGVRLGPQYTKTYGAGAAVTSNAGGVLTGILEQTGDNEIHTYYFKPIQTLINGVWANIAG